MTLLDLKPRGTGGWGGGPGGVDGEGAVGGENLATDVEVGGEVNLDNKVHPGAAGDVGYPLHHVFGAVVNGMVGAGFNGDAGFLVGADGGDDIGPGQLGELDGVVADGSRPSGDQHGLSVHRAVGEDTAVGGHRGDAEASPLGEGGVAGQKNGVACGLDGVLGRGTKRPVVLGLEEPDPFPDPRRRDAIADLLDDSSAVLIGYDPGKVDAPGQSLAALPVRGIDARRYDPHLYFARARLRVGHIAQLEDVGGAVLLIPYCFHAMSVRYWWLRPLYLL